MSGTGRYELPLPGVLDRARPADQTATSLLKMALMEFNLVSEIGAIEAKTRLPHVDRHVGCAPIGAISY